MVHHRFHYRFSERYHTVVRKKYCLFHRAKTGFMIIGCVKYFMVIYIFRFYVNGECIRRASCTTGDYQLEVPMHGKVFFFSLVETFIGRNNMKFLLCPAMGHFSSRNLTLSSTILLFLKSLTQNSIKVHFLRGYYKVKIMLICKTWF